MSAHNRRADDWRETSPRSLPKSMLNDLARELGYPPASVFSIRMNQGEVTVTFHDGNGMPRSARHLYRA